MGHFRLILPYKHIRLHGRHLYADPTVWSIKGNWNTCGVIHLQLKLPRVEEGSKQPSAAWKYYPVPSPHHHRMLPIVLRKEVLKFYCESISKMGQRHGLEKKWRGFINLACRGNRLNPREDRWKQITLRGFFIKVLAESISLESNDKLLIVSAAKNITNILQKLGLIIKSWRVNEIDHNLDNS